jgi:hypothetical protein
MLHARVSWGSGPSGQVVLVLDCCGFCQIISERYLELVLTWCVGLGSYHGQ